MGHTPRVLALALGLAAACADSGEQNASAKPHVANPLLRDGAKDAVQDLTYDEYKKYVKDDAKLYHVMALFNVVKDRQERECPSNCVWMDKQFDTLAEAYIQQRNGREVYEYDGRPVYFARVALPTRSDKVASEVGGIPSLFLSRAKSSKQTRYGHSNLLEDAKRIPDFEKMPAKLRAGKYSVLKYLKKADTRAERRRRGLATQEEREEAAYGISDYHSPHMTNLCKWLRLKTKHQIATCPQDVDRNIASTEKKSETGKNILVSIIGVSSLLFLARVFGTPLAPVDPSKEDYKRKLHLAAEIVEGNDVHVMYKYVDPWWNLWLRLVSLLAIVMVSCCASGMYHNVLHKTPLEGTAFDAPYSKVTGYKGQLPYQSLWIAAMISIASLALIALGRVATLNYAFLKVPMFFVCAIAWMSAGGFLLHLFTDKNRWYISGTFLHGYIMQLLQKS